MAFFRHVSCRICCQLSFAVNTDRRTHNLYSICRTVAIFNWVLFPEHGNCARYATTKPSVLNAWSEYPVGLPATNVRSLANPFADTSRFGTSTSCSDSTDRSVGFHAYTPQFWGLLQKSCDGCDITFFCVLLKTEIVGYLKALGMMIYHKLPVVMP